LKLTPNQIVSSLIGRFLIKREQNHYDSFQIYDDNGVSTMISAFEQQSAMAMLELYVEIDVIGSSSVAI